MDLRRRRRSIFAQGVESTPVRCDTTKRLSVPVAYAICRSGQNYDDGPWGRGGRVGCFRCRLLVLVTSSDEMCVSPAPGIHVLNGPRPRDVAPTTVTGGAHCCISTEESVCGVASHTRVLGETEVVCCSCWESYLTDLAAIHTEVVVAGW